MPPDAFEVALLDPVTGASLLGALGGLDLSDAFLNLQADGTVYLAPGVTLVGDPHAGQATVTVSLAGVDTSNGALLSFDLFGQGAQDSLVEVDDIAFGGTITTEIGRASCRGRVCQYVLISVAAVPLKQQQHTSRQDNQPK